MKTVFTLVALLVVLVGGFMAFNTYIYNEKQGDEAVLENSEHFGFIHAFTDNNTSLDFDDAEWLTGKEAEDAAIQAGLCTNDTREECTPNDFFIKNEDQEDTRVVVAPTATVVMQTWQMEQTGQVASQEISVAEFSELINNPTLHWNNLPYRITISNNTVTHIEEVYVP